MLFNLYWCVDIMTAVANYKALFNAFDDHVQQPKFPDNSSVSSAGLKVRETFVLKCNELLRTSTTPGSPFDENKNVLVYFHPGLAQNFYAMAYKFNPSDASGNIPDEYNVYWRILKVGNNGVPFNIRSEYRRSLDVNGRPVHGLLCKDVSGLKIKAARVVSSAMRIFNVGLQVADVIEVKQDLRPPSDEFARMLVPKKEVVNNQTFGEYTPTTDIEKEMVVGAMLALFPFRKRPVDDGSLLESITMFDYVEEPNAPKDRRLNMRLLNNSVGWEDAPFHTVLPSGSVRGLQINAVPVTDNRHFREWRDFLCTQNTADFALPLMGRLDGFAELENHVSVPPITPSSVTFNRHCRYYPTEESSKITEFFADPDFMGTWIRIIQPNSDLEILFECVTNYELLCYPDSPYYTFTSYNDKLPISISDVRSLVETTYGNLFSWEIQVANDVSKTIEDYVGNYASYGSTTSGVVLKSNNISIRPNETDNGFLNSTMYDRKVAEVGVKKASDSAEKREKVVLPESYATFFKDIYKREEDEEDDDEDMVEPKSYTPRRYAGDVKGSYAPLIPPENFQISGNSGYKVAHDLKVDGRPPRLLHKKKKHKTKFDYYR